MSKESHNKFAVPSSNEMENVHKYNNNHYVSNGGGYNSTHPDDLQNGNSRKLPLDEESVVMTPRGKTSNSTVILVERKLVNSVNERQHVAGGDHSGIIINKDISQGQKSEVSPPQLSLEFRVFLVSGNTGQHSQESRTLRFWFRPWIVDAEKRAHIAQDFFRELVRPQEFPRDYVGFIKKIMKMLQKGFNDIQALEVELKLLEQVSTPPSRPPNNSFIIYSGDSNRKFDEVIALSSEQRTVSPEDTLQVQCLTTEKVLELIERAYPNPVTAEDLSREYGWSETDVLEIILSLKKRGILKSMEYNSFTRVHYEETEIQIVKQMPTIASHKQPTIAIITAQYAEKLAVDAMLENKETFVRYTTVGNYSENIENGSSPHQKKKSYFGESNVYTLGNIGAHRIVSTKLPSLGSSRESMTATGNTTTRLLGTFQKVDYVFIVGVAGGVPHYTDYNKHVRLGDVVVSCPDENSSNYKDESSKIPCIYVSNNGEEDRYYNPKNKCLQDISQRLKNVAKSNRPWATYFEEGLNHLQIRTDNDFSRPAANSDKLYMNIGNGEVIEIQHPLPIDNAKSFANEIRLHCGPVGSGKNLLKSDSSRINFAHAHSLLATDVGMSPVLDSIIGNCHDSFIMVEGISDYRDGSTSKKWQNYAALAAAAVMKSIICGMEPPTNV